MDFNFVDKNLGNEYEVKKLSSTVREWQKRPLSFVRDMFHVKPTDQQALMLSAAGEVGAHVAVKSGHGAGKLQSVCDIISTPTGERVWGDLKAGDLVFGVDGNPQRIVKVHDRVHVPLYRVRFDDGSSLLCGLDHLWTVRGRSARRTGRDAFETITTDELMRRGIKRSNGSAANSVSGGARQWEIPRHGAVKYESVAVQLEPYLMGVWLGRGTARSGGLTIADDCPEIIEMIKSFGYIFSIRQDDNKKCKTITPHGLRRKIKNTGVLGCRAWEKFVPDIYKFNDIQTRLEVLRGLMDTDGECSKSGNVIFGSTSRRLVEDAIWLARSLGGKAQIQPTVKRGRYRNDAGEIVECRDFWRCTIRMPSEYPPFRVSKKLERVKQVEDRYLVRWIDSIEYEKDDWAQCITVSNPDGLYLSNDFIVTHNSTCFAWLALWGLTCFEDVKIGCTAPTAHQLQDVIWAEVRKWRNKMLEPWKSAIEITSDKIQLAGTPNFAIARTSRKDNPDAMQGLHAPTMIFLIDEASGIPDVVFEVAQGALSTPGARVIMAGNPTRTTGYFYRAFHASREYWKTFTFHCADSPLVARDYLKQMAEEYGEDSDIYRVRVAGEFPSGGDMQFIKTTDVDAAAGRILRDDMFDFAPVVLGVDVAWYGGDSSVIVLRQGLWSDIVWTAQGVDPTTLAGIVAQKEDEYRADAVFVDATGIGAGVLSNLRAMGRDPIRVDFGGSSSKPGYLNKRAECWGNMREWLTVEGGRIPNDQRLKDDLTGLEYHFNVAGKLQLERKEDMKRRGLASPDCFIAGTMVATPTGGVPIESLSVGDEVVTPVGTRRIVKVWGSDTDALTTVKFSNGSVLTGKPNHDALTLANGWRKIKDLQCDDAVESLSLWRFMSWVVLSRLFTRESGSGFKQQAGIINPARRMRKRDFYIVASGLTTTGIFLRGMLCITKTVTGAITALRIWRLNRSSITCQSTCESGLRIKNMLKRIALIFRGHRKRPRPGMRHLTVLHGTAHTGLTVGLEESPLSLFVPCAARSTKRSSRQGQGFAVELASNGKDTSGTKLRSESARTAGKNSSTTNTRRRSVVPVSVETDYAVKGQEKTRVYNLTLDKDNVYYANNILVSNCADALSLTFSVPIKPRNEKFRRAEALAGQYIEEYNEYNPFEFKGRF